MERLLAALRAAAARGDQEAAQALRAMTARLGCGRPATHVVAAGHSQAPVGAWCRPCAGRVADRLSRSRGRYGPGYRRRPGGEENPGPCRGDSHPRAWPAGA